MGNATSDLESNLESTDGQAQSQSQGVSQDVASLQLPPEFSVKYEVLSSVGKGGFGNVYKIRDIRTKAVYAVKILPLNESNLREVELQAKIDDKHVVKIFDTVQSPSTKQLFIIMEYCEGGNLLQWVERNRKHDLLNETVVLQMLYEICEAVYSCHQKKIIHRDLKPENILLDSKRRIKLADFGVARVLERTSVATSFCGTPPYMAPELFLSYLSRGRVPGEVEGYDYKCDVWSIGCILWDMANSSNRFVHTLQSNVGLNAAQAKSDSVGVKEIEAFIEKDVPQGYVLTKRLLHSMLKKNPEERVSLSEVLQDTTLREALENPLGGHWSDIYDKIHPDSAPII
ncbi:probable serine/threonine-protein kinase nek2 [Halichondria panicea]|uniref:probable serine/threonine-protein kinase nek2 n=1 Tax=Halichondria panicea TaxID=6063 RepID=UPI00312B691F